jgi:hypothetical protein
MTKQEYFEMYQKTPKWELLHMKKALQVLGGFLNSDEDNLRLEVIKQVLKAKKN